MYSPSIKWLVDNDDWGDLESNRRNLVPYPWGAQNPINRSLYGINMDGEMIGIMGPEKGRKTTFALNIVHFIMVQEKPKVKPEIAILTLESGSRPRKIKDIFISMMATQILAGNGYRDQCVISPKFLRYNKRTPEQQGAIDQAIEIVREWPIRIYGPGIDEGDTRNPKAAQFILEKEDARIVILDHAQQLSFGGESYDVLNKGVDMFAFAINRKGIVGILISQVSLTSLRAVQRGEGELRAHGGKRLDEESNVVFLTEAPENDLMEISIHRARDGERFTIIQPVNSTSGLFWREPKLKYEPKA